MIFCAMSGALSPVTTFAQTPKLPAHATALGKALLAFSSPELVDRIIADGLERYTQNTLTDPERLRQSLASIRLTRVAVSRWELEPEVSAVAAPVFGSGGMAVAAPELTVPDLRSDLQTASSVLTVACHPPAAWDQVEGFSAMSMGPPGRQ